MAAKPRSKDNTAPSIADLEAEKRAAYQSKDEKRLKEVVDKLNFLYYGIKS